MKQINKELSYIYTMLIIMDLMQNDKKSIKIWKEIEGMKKEINIMNELIEKIKRGR